MCAMDQKSFQHCTVLSIFRILKEHPVHTDGLEKLLLNNYILYEWHTLDIKFSKSTNMA